MDVSTVDASRPLSQADEGFPSELKWHLQKSILITLMFEAKMRQLRGLDALQAEESFAASSVFFLSFFQTTSTHCFKRTLLATLSTDAAQYDEVAVLAEHHCTSRSCALLDVASRPPVIQVLIDKRCDMGSIGMRARCEAAVS